LGLNFYDEILPTLSIFQRIVSEGGVDGGVVIAR
jgi:hypothetical protein